MLLTLWTSEAAILILDCMITGSIIYWIPDLKTLEHKHDLWSLARSFAGQIALPSPYILGPNSVAYKFGFCFDPSLPIRANDPYSAFFFGRLP